MKPDRDKIHMTFYDSPDYFNHTDHGDLWRICVDLYPDYWREKQIETELNIFLNNFEHRNFPSSNGWHEYSYNDCVEYNHYNIDCYSEKDGNNVCKWLINKNKELPPDYKFDKDNENIHVIRFRKDSKQEIEKIYEWIGNQFENVIFHEIFSLTGWHIQSRQQYRKYQGGIKIELEKKHLIILKLGI